MAHNLDVNAGQASFVSAREDAWHRLGTTLDHAFTAQEAMTEGLLGKWNVRKVPLCTDDQPSISVPGRYATVRDNPVNADRQDVLGVVGETYRVIQNEAHADLLNALVDESGAHFETAGAIDGGRQVFITMKLPDHILVGGVDRVDTYLAAINSHDGSSAFTLMVTPVRIVCQNTLNVAYGKASGIFRVRHSSGADARMLSTARETLDLTFGFIAGFQEQADRLLDTAMTSAQFDAIIKSEYGAPEGAAPATVTRSDRKMAEMTQLFSEAATQENIRGTAWAGFNALAEWDDFFSPIRGVGDRSKRSALDPYFKTRALALMSRV